jgi:hypothetical protein
VASVHGRLFVGENHETSFEFLASAEVHGAGPFRIVLTRSDSSGAQVAIDAARPERTIEFRRPRIPSSGERVQLDAELGTRAEIRSIQPGSERKEGAASGEDFKFDDGSFIIHPTSGSFELRLEGTQPGDAVTGTFELQIKTGETVSGTFAAALAD